MTPLVDEGKLKRKSIAPQSLALLNSALTLDAARYLAGAVMVEAAKTGGRPQREVEIELAYRRALGRRPDPIENRLALEFLRALTAQIKAAGRLPADLALPRPLPRDASPAAAASLTAFCLSLFNVNEFVYLD